MPVAGLQATGLNYARNYDLNTFDNFKNESRKVKNILGYCQDDPFISVSRSLPFFHRHNSMPVAPKEHDHSHSKREHDHVHSKKEHDHDHSKKDHNHTHTNQCTSNSKNIKNIVFYSKDDPL